MPEGAIIFHRTPRIVDRICDRCGVRNPLSGYTCGSLFLCEDCNGAFLTWSVTQWLDQLPGVKI